MLKEVQVCVMSVVQEGLGPGMGASDCVHGRHSSCFDLQMWCFSDSSCWCLPINVPG